MQPSRTLEEVDGPAIVLLLVDGTRNALTHILIRWYSLHDETVEWVTVMFRMSRFKRTFSKMSRR